MRRHLSHNQPITENRMKEVRLSVSKGLVSHVTIFNLFMFRFVLDSSVVFFLLLLFSFIEKLFKLALHGIHFIFFCILNSKLDILL